jgi:hypothetical protein
MADVNDVNVVTFISQIIKCPFESILAALGEIQSYTNSSIFCHFCESGEVELKEERRRRNYFDNGIYILQKKKKGTLLTKRLALE